MLKLFWIELARTFVLTIRYPSNFVSSMLVGTLMFYGLFMGAKYLSNQDVFGSSLDAMIVGWTAWVLATKGLTKPPQSVQGEADTGVLESIFLSGYRTSVIFFVRAMCESVVDFLMIVGMVLLLAWLTGSAVGFPPAIALPAVTLVLAANGMGMGLAGFALQVKRIGSVLPMLQMFLLVLIFTPFETWTTGFESGIAAIAMWLPMVPSVILLRDLMAFGKDLDPTLATQALLNGAGWVALGALVFDQMAKRVKVRGLLAGY
jgi:ABC-2 type transport system permease protein